MSDSFTKLFSSIITSSIWSEDDKTRIMWITILATTDADGFCSASIPGLAAVARMSLSDTEKCIQKLESPDPYSRTKNHEGRRIERVDGGWIVLNYVTYRDRTRIEQRREYLAEKQREHRAKSRMSTSVNKTSTNDSASTSSSKSESSEEGIVKGIELEFEECWKLYPDKSGKNKAFTAYQRFRKEGGIQQDVLSGLNRYLAYLKLRQGSDFPDLKPKNGATWFHQQCWKDEYTYKQQAKPRSGMYD